MTKYAEYRKLQNIIEKEWGMEDTMSIFGLQAYYLKTEEMEEAEIPVKGTRHPSTRDDRRIATKHHKRKDKWLHSKRVAFSGRLNGGDRRTAEKKALRNWREEYEDVNVFVRSGSTWRYWEDDTNFLYNLRVWDEDEALWNQAWSERAEEEYWERVEAEEWEEMRTSEEVSNFFPDNDDLSPVRVCGLERDSIFPVGCPEPDFAVTYEGHVFTADTEKGAAWLYDRLKPFYGDKVKFEVLFSPVVTSGWEWSITVEGHTFTVIGEEGFRWLHRKLSAFYEVDFDVRLV